jgi:ribosomal protein S18 acetylase RimI-like enzyme
MGSVAPEFPFFVSNVPRALTAQEQADDLRWRLEAMPSVSVVCACVDDEIVGFKIGYAHSQSRYYSWLGGVKPQRRRRGIGAQMMELQHA